MPQNIALCRYRLEALNHAALTVTEAHEVAILHRMTVDGLQWGVTPFENVKLLKDDDEWKVYLKVIYVPPIHS